MKKITLLLLIVFVFSTEHNFAQVWEKVSTASFTSLLNKVLFINSQTGWIAGEKGVVYKSTDGGQNWNQQICNTKKKLNSISFLDDQKGFIVGDSCVILRTNDGGSTWIEDSITVIEKKASLKVVYFCDSSTGWILASTSAKGWVIHTTDGGKTWNINLSASKELFNMSIRNSGVGVVCGANFNNLFYTKDGVHWNNSISPSGFDYNYTRKEIKAVQMVNDSIGYASGSGFYSNQQPCLLFKTSDGGITWKNIKLSAEVEPYETLSDIIFTDENNGIIAGGMTQGSVFLKTSDGGLNWKQTEAPFGSAIKSVCSSGDRYWAVGFDGIIASSADGDIWQLITPTLNCRLMSLEFPTKDVGYAGGYSGALSKTTDGGKTWKSSYVSANHKSFNVNDISFINNDIGFAAHSYRMVTKTTDGGKTWNIIMPDTTAANCSALKLNFVNENFGVVIGKDPAKSGIIYRTTDGGSSWTTKRGIINGNLLNLDFRNLKYGICVGENMNSLYTTDGGESWLPSAYGTNVPIEKFTSPINDVTFLNDSIAVAVGDRIILKSVDHGSSWMYIPNCPDLELNNVIFEDEKTGYACGTADVFMTSDGGETWVSINDPNIVQTSTLSLAISKPGTVFIGGYNNTIYKYETSISNITDIKDKNYSLVLKQNYPNPFNPVTTIEYEIPSNGYMKLIIYDILGRKIKTLSDGYYQKGKYRINFDASSLSSGIYYYTLQNEDFSVTKKMQLLK